MADITRTITVEFTKVFKDAKEGDQTGWDENLEFALNFAFGASYDLIKITKTDDIVSKSKPKLTKRERAFCELIPDGYIARDKDTDLWWHEYRPIKDGIREWAPGGEYINLELFDEIPFMFITWEDDEPWAVEELLKLEVEE